MGGHREGSHQVTTVASFSVSPLPSRILQPSSNSVLFPLLDNSFPFSLTPAVSDALGLQPVQQAGFLKHFSTEMVLSPADAKRKHSLVSCYSLPLASHAPLLEGIPLLGIPLSPAIPSALQQLLLLLLEISRPLAQSKVRPEGQVPGPNWWEGEKGVASLSPLTCLEQFMLFPQQGSSDPH